MELVGKIVGLIFPPRCLLCNQPGCDGLDLCAECREKLPWNTSACCCCAIPLAQNVYHEETPVLCGRCQQKRPAFDEVISLFRYEADAINMIHLLKFNQQLAYARLLGMLLVDRVKQQAPLPACLLPVPLHNTRLRARGFNQSTEIARVLSRALALPILLDPVVRVRKTGSQSGLHAQQRRQNIKGAFEIVGEIPFRHVAIIDDVVTTGSTANELARVLKKAGVERVDVYCIARA